MKTRRTTTKRAAKQTKPASAPRQAPKRAVRRPRTSPPSSTSPSNPSNTSNRKVAAALRRAEDALWETGLPPHRLLQELHESLLLRCLEEADGNYAAAAAKFGPSRQSVQQYANSPLRDQRWKRFQQNRRRKRGA